MPSRRKPIKPRIKRKPAKHIPAKRKKPRASRAEPPQREPEQRRGPRPLALHLLTAEITWSGLRAALPALNAGLLRWPANLASEAASLRARLLAENPALAGQSPADLRHALAETIDRIGERRLLALTAGVGAYRAHPYRRDLSEPPTIWREGTTRLLDYGTRGRKTRVGVLVIPSLVNRGYVLDLTARTSLMRHLASQGLRPFLVDWDAPGPLEKTFGLDEYIAGRLSGALDAAMAAQGGPVAVLGYCMGGDLALALALRRPHDVLGLACLATPWDFQADGPLTTPLDPTMAATLRAAFEAMPECPVDLLQAMFASLDPFLVNRKYRAFAQTVAKTGETPNGNNGELFVAIEDWVNDGVPLASKVASQCLVEWYGENAPARGRWHVAGQVVDPGSLRCPALVIVPARDRVVPPASAMALATAIPHAQCLSVPSGHVAMIVGDQAPRLTWQPLVAWLNALSPSPGPAAKRSRGRGKRSSA